MSPRISPEQVRHVANLARLSITDSEASQLAEELGVILEHAEDVAALDLSDIEPTAHPIHLTNVLRDDAPRPSLDRDEVLAAAPATEDRRFRVPRIMGETQ